jgi:hypothetical protein
VGAIHHRCVLAKNSIRLVASNTRGDVRVCQDDPEAKFAIARAKPLRSGFRAFILAETSRVFSTRSSKIILIADGARWRAIGDERVLLTRPAREEWDKT